MYCDGVLSAASYIWKRDGYEEDVERVRDVTGAGIVKVENERQLERERHLGGTTRATGTEGGRDREQSQVKLCSDF